jgi:hypothetical protein
MTGSGTVKKQTSSSRLRTVETTLPGLEVEILVVGIVCVGPTLL